MTLIAGALTGYFSEKFDNGHVRLSWQICIHTHTHTHTFIYLNCEKWYEWLHVDQSHGALLGCEIKRSVHALSEARRGEASAYVTLVKFEQSVVLSLARTIT
jgi:hypothetical protein